MRSRGGGSLRRLLGTAALLLLAGCEAAPPGADAAAVAAFDSAGIEILHVRWDEVPRGRAVSAEPAWSTDARPPGSAELTLHQVQDAALMADGTAVIAEAGSQAVIAFDTETGRFRRWGSRGDGPLQFQGVASVAPRGEERFAVVDRVRGRYLEFDREGELLAEHGLASALPGAAAAVALAPDGAVYAAVHGQLDEGPGVMRRRGRVLRIEDPARPRVDTLGPYAGIETYRGEGYMGLLFFGADGVMAAAEGGTWIGDTGDPEVAYWEGPDGPARLVRWSREGDRAITEARRAALFDALLSHVPSEDRELMEGERERIVFRDELPAFEAIVAGEDGTLWIGEYTVFLADRLEVPRPPQEWLVIDLAEGSATRVVTPAGFRLLRAADGFILGVYRDHLGVESVRRHDLR